MSEVVQVLNQAILPPLADIWQCLKTLLVLMTWRHLAHRDQACCETSYATQDSPTTKNYPAPNINSAQAEKPCSKVTPAQSGYLLGHCTSAIQ